VPLFAVETIRSLVDRDVVQPIDGVYRLVGEVGELAVPESLHGLLAARLDALDPAVRALVADAAVLGTSFPAEALVAVSDQSESAVRAGLDELVRREVLAVSADPLSPERGSYHFAQQLLRQVAYDTLSRRDRKARHLTVAAHLRATFADDGEEVADAIARHYRDALAAVADDTDVDAIRAQAIALSGRAGRRAIRAGSPAAAVDAYVAAASLAGDAGMTDEAQWWEHASEAAELAGLMEDALAHSRRAQALHEAAGRPRDAARAQTMVGRVIGLIGQSNDARTELTAALDVLRPEPNADTVRTLTELTTLTAAMGDPNAQALGLEALDLAEALAVSQRQLAHTFTAAGMSFSVADRVALANALFEYGAAIAERAGDRHGQARALVNISDTVAGFDPAAGAAAAQQGVDIARATGSGGLLSFATSNLAESLLLVGEWDQAEKVLTNAISEEHAQEWIACWHVLMLGLRGDAEAARSLRDRISLRDQSEDPQDIAGTAFVEAAIAHAAGDFGASLRQARKALSHVDGIGLKSDSMRWSWTLAERAARSLGDAGELQRLVTMVDSHPAGGVPPTTRAGADLTRIHLGAVEPAAIEETFERAITTLRDLPAPYHLAWALLDRGTEADVAEAAAIAERLRAAPLKAAVAAARTVVGAAFQGN
jgi:tetratricopeptide (TPR) repeat protein